MRNFDGQASRNSKRCNRETHGLLGPCLLAAVLLAVGGVAATSAKPPETTVPVEKLDGRDGRPLALENFRPQSRLRVAEHHLTHAKYPVVDVHTHFRIRFHHSPEQLDDFVKLMDKQNIAVCVSLDGGMGEQFTEHEKYLWTKYPDRFVIYANVDWQGGGKPNDWATWDCQRPDFGRRMARNLADLKKKGISGLKVFKQLGLEYRNPDGSLIRIDDERWDPIWEACGELGLPVIMHTADPSAFFQPIDEHNERWEELHRHPEWSFYGPQWPSREELHAERNHIVERHPKTRFIFAHFGNDAEDLAQTAEWLDKYPNVIIEFASRIAELGRQPYTAREFFLKHADRIMFGTDGPRVAERLLLYWRFLETKDEYFPYAETAFPPQGLWQIYGLGLPDDVLKKVYYENAERFIPGVKERVEKYQTAHSSKS